ncbi:arsenate reductase ArsC [Absicoccus porci]|uniref:Arsenate reductase ArsC n=1 Tax=Absicoccus porci TaxID=2486576 RepID=A0A3N0I3Q9_9FIRM|nr:arsenate reductase ArsC [Absicoccus porci]RNM31130.1 arsenate reductase ArsC [Absicoccus porci]
MKKWKVGFICTHNSCRSQIAEAFGKELASDVFESYSAGTQIKDQINPDAVRILKAKYGMDMIANGQYNKTLDQLPKLDVVITMGCGVQCPMIDCTYREDWGLQDPTGESDAVFIQVIEEIETRIRSLKQRLTKDELCML